MFDRFTEGARQATVASQEEARSRGCDAIEPGHLVLALLRLPDDPGMRRALGPLVAPVADVLAEVEAVVPAGSHERTDAIPFSADAREVLARAASLAKGLEAGHIGTEHLLLAVVGGADPTAAVFARNGADRDAILAALREGSEAPGFEVRTTRGFGRFRRSRSRASGRTDVPGTTGVTSAPGDAGTERRAGSAGGTDVTGGPDVTGTEGGTGDAGPAASG